MHEIRKYYLPPTDLIPNSPLPLLHYPGFLGGESNFTDLARKVYGLFTENGWQVQWLVRYGPTQPSHYHSRIHECMAVLSGSATIRFGVADAKDGVDSITASPSQLARGIEIQASAGDVFIIPAGVAHKTFDTTPRAEFQRLTPGDGHQDVTDHMRSGALASEPGGFTMLGAYPSGSGTWDFAVGGEDSGQFEEVWQVSPPARDPVLGLSDDGLKTLWRLKSDA